MDKDLGKMLGVLENVPDIYKYSRHWQRLTKLHLNQLKVQGLGSFKRTVNLKYFNWGIPAILVHQTRHFFKLISNGNSDFLKSTLYGKCDLKKSGRLSNRIFNFLYSRYVASLYEYVKTEDYLDIFSQLDEPLYGKPLLVRYKGKCLSQDLCNSISEFYSIYNAINFGNVKSIAEIGAGYGRNAYIFLRLSPKIKYFIIDLPPSLFIAQDYFRKIMPSVKRFYFRNFKSFLEVEKEIKFANLIFLMPHQIELLPRKMFDLMINISSLHEMEIEQINNYLHQIGRLCKGYFYSKQWKRAIVGDNNFINLEKYVIPRKWKKVFFRTSSIQRLFFEALYKVN